MPEPTVQLPSFDRAAELLARLGFALIRGDRPETPGGSNLLVAIREVPTLQHFDPERVMYWISTDGRGRHTEIDRSVPLPFETPFSWGTMVVTDRLDVTNTFLTFGGVLSAQALDPTTTIAIFGSPAPMLRWTGHSQDVDPLSAEVAAFFARVRVPINFTTGAEARISSMSPLMLYAAFITDLRRRYTHSAGLRDANRDINQLVARESRWVESAAPNECAAGHELLRDLGFEPVAPPADG